jgi:hypothetical protein
MKKLLMSSVVLIAFSLAIIVFQMSCKKDADAQTAQGGIAQQNILLIQKSNNGGSGELWTSNYDGSNQKRIPITLQTGQTMGNDQQALSPDGKMVFFTIEERRLIAGVSTKFATVYSCNIDGSNYKQIIDATGNDQYVAIVGAY